MPARLLEIGADDAPWPDRFSDFVAGVFSGLGFRSWAERGGWGPDYRVFLLAEGERVVASVGRMRMRLVLDGRETAAYQLGAVATDPGRRGRGLSRRLIERATDKDEIGEAPVFLFANETVTGFYPRFGFRGLVQQRFTAAAELRPWGEAAPRFRVDDPAERERLAALCASTPPAGAVAVLDNYAVLLWHLVNRPLQAFWLEDGEALVVLEPASPRLIVHDCVALRPPMLAEALPRTIAEPVVTLEFGFDPAAVWPDAVPSDDADSLLFARGFPDLSSRPFRLPNLAQT